MTETMGKQEQIGNGIKQSMHNNSDLESKINE